LELLLRVALEPSIVGYGVGGTTGAVDEGALVGLATGEFVGACVGRAVGRADGASVGFDVGDIVLTGRGVGEPRPGDPIIVDPRPPDEIGIIVGEPAG